MDELLLKAKKFDVTRREYDIPTLGKVSREMIAHPGAVLIIPVLSPTELVVIRNYRFTVGAELIELPAGTLEAGEDRAVCAGRELEEETGYVAAEIIPLCEFYTSPGFTDELMSVYIARGLTKTQQDLDETEQIRVSSMELEDALRATIDGRIIDGKTIASLHLYTYTQANGSDA